MEGFSPDAFRFALSQIKDGDIFERFGLDFLSKVLGYNFVPAGGLKDRGIDGLEHTFQRRGLERTIYQLSIQKDYKGKIRDTLDKLNKYKVKYNQFVYITNIPIPSLDLLIDELIQDYESPIFIYDVNWLANHVNDSEATVRSFQIFIDSYLHQFNQPGQSYTVANLEKDPRLYIFLRQQWDEHRNDLKLDKVLADTLILFALKDTDSDKEILLTRDEIVERTRDYVEFDPRVFRGLIDQRLKILSRKPRRINYHRSKDAYCLRYEERVRIQEHNLSDVALWEEFRSDTRAAIANCISDDILSEVDFLPLIEGLLHSLFYRQGVQFADFILHESSEDVFEQSLPEIVSEVVEKSARLTNNRQQVKNALLTMIRNLVYSGTYAQKEFLNRLSHTYMMLLLLQCDPNLCTYFSSMASKLRVYACTSIIIPALSERSLEQRNRRYTNLLLGARQSGVKLWFNEPILKELVAHFRMIRDIFQQRYEDKEDIYTDELSLIYVPEIMIRAYFYTKLRGDIDKFEDFIGSFVSPNMRRLEDDIVQFLTSEFGMEYVPNAALGIHLDPKQVTEIQGELAKYKGSKEDMSSQIRARTDAEVMLTIHTVRDHYNELGTTGIFGYQTWWLSSDVTTQMAAVAVGGEKFTRTCYMRPDFLYNYISLAPLKGVIDQSFQKMFPTLLGINISWQLPQDVVTQIHKYMKQHKETNIGRLKATLRELADDLKQDPSNQTSAYAKLFLQKHLVD
jgi:hypothetical protein